MRTMHGRSDHEHAGAANAAGATPGKQTLTSALSHAPIAGGTSALGATPGKQTQTGDGAPAPPAAPVQAKAADGASASAAAEDVHASAQSGIGGLGGPLPHLDRIQQSFGRHNVGHVQAHQDERAAGAAQSMGAMAYATGNHVAFAGAPSLHTAAHEAAHVVQQRAGVHLSGGVGQAADAYEQHADQVADRVVRGESSEALLGDVRDSGGGGAAVQRYEAGEHARTGETQAQLKAAYAPLKYTVVKGDTVASIADKFKLSVTELKDANPDRLHKVHPAAGSKDKEVEVFNAGDQLAIPQKLTEMARDAVKDPSIKVTVNGVVLDYGTLIAMGGDLYGSPEEMAKAPPDELKEIAALVAEEKQTGKPVSTERWQKATKGRMVALAAKNDAHFAPTNPDLVASAGKSTGDHKQSWEDNHHKAIDAARAGDKDKALMLNAFADHFLTDAFAAGHLFNKSDVMERFNSQLPQEGKGKDRHFTDDAKTFFDAISKAAFVGDVKTQFSLYETADAYALGWHPNINSESRFSSLLQGIHQERPDLLSSAVAKGVHDKLNTRPGGLPVENALHEKWELSGDNTLNDKTLAMAQRAVAQSQRNVLDSFRATAPADYPALFKQVWDLTPRPTAESAKEISGTIQTGSDVKSKDLQSAIVGLIKANYLTIIDELVKLKKLRKA